ACVSLDFGSGGAKLELDGTFSILWGLKTFKKTFFTKQIVPATFAPVPGAQVCLAFL
ncbi:hypothetical protein HKX48_001520, partial [Thoreauomyces humboldtii]